MARETIVIHIDRPDPGDDPAPVQTTVHVPWPPGTEEPITRIIHFDLPDLQQNELAPDIPDAPPALHTLSIPWPGELPDTITRIIHVVLPDDGTPPQIFAVPVAPADDPNG